MKLTIRALLDVGKFQWCVLWLSTLTSTPTNWGNYGVLYMVPNLDCWCDYPDPAFQNLTRAEQREVVKNWPKCMQPTNSSEPVTYTPLQLGNSTEDFEKCDKIYCDKGFLQWTVTEKFRLYCDREWLINLGNTIYMAGYFVSAFICGAISDRFGRRSVLLGSGVLGTLSSVLAAQAPVVEVYLVARFILSIADVASFESSYVLCMEILRKDQRILAGGMSGFFSLITYSGLAAMFTLLPNYEHLCYLFAALFAFFFFVNWWFFPESSRWLMSRKRYEDADKEIRRIARFNNQDPDELEYLIQQDQDDDTEVSVNPINLLRTPVLRARTLIQWLIWMNVVLVNYGILFNLGDFGWDIRLTIIMYGIIQYPFWMVCMYLAEKIGRQASLFLFILLSGICCACMSPIVEDRDSMLLLILALLGKSFASNQFSLIYQYTPELYPTVIRNMGLGAASTIARVAGMIAPLISLLNVYWPPMLVVILGSASILTSFLIPLLPDTTGHEMAQTIEEGEKFLAEHKYGLVLPPDFECCCCYKTHVTADRISEPRDGDADAILPAES